MQSIIRAIICDAATR